MKLLGLAAKATILVVVYIALVEPGFFGVIHQHFLRAAILLWLLGEVSRYFAIEIARRSALNRTVRNLLSSAYAVFALLIILEIVFVFMPQSHGAGYTLGARNWFDYFWSANEIGYRDKPLQEVDRGKPRILVVGDSFTAGHGIRNPDDTYVGQLRNLTSDN
ncbi:MAG: hypothetical protein OEQ25_18240, partial [Gammaproteobacteria bacterium]|nr:hypothetical protein [Gammaproteobacteria bacterium]